MKVYIDPGHNYSGVDTGATGFGLREQDITYEIAAVVKEILTAHGVTIMMSRNKLTDNVVSGGTVNDSLRARYSAANNWKANIFVSIHCNSGKGTGSEVYCYKTGGSAETLAKTVLNGIICNTGLKSRGVKTANYAVIKNTTMPAVLAETAFIDNENDAKLLGSKDGQRAIAKGIAEGIMEYLGIKYSSNAPLPDNTNSGSNELSAPAEIVQELSRKNLVSDKEGMISEINDNPNGRLYWLARKTANSVHNN